MEDNDNHIADGSSDVNNPFILPSPQPSTSSEEDEVDEGLEQSCWLLAERGVLTQVAANSLLDFCNTNNEAPPLHNSDNANHLEHFQDQQEQCSSVTPPRDDGH